MSKKKKSKPSLKILEDRMKTEYNKAQLESLARLRDNFDPETGQAQNILLPPKLMVVLKLKIYIAKTL